MTQINSVSSANPNNNTKRPIINAKTTGYTAATAMGITMLGGITKDKFLMKNHKVFAGISLVAVAAHLYIVLSKRKQYKQTQPQNNTAK